MNESPFESFEQFEFYFELLQEIVRECTLGSKEKASFTGNNKTLLGGKAVIQQVRCKKCVGLFWINNIPYPYCPDCRKD